jgi:hypothetical protein
VAATDAEATLVHSRDYGYRTMEVTDIVGVPETGDLWLQNSRLQARTGTSLRTNLS